MDLFLSVGPRSAFYPQHGYTAGPPQPFPPTPNGVVNAGPVQQQFFNNSYPPNPPVASYQHQHYNMPQSRGKFVCFLCWVPDFKAHLVKVQMVIF